MPSGMWATIHAERKALLADLEPLSDEQWNTTSLCAEWTVLEATGHMIATALKTPASFFVGLVKSGFRLRKMQATDIAAAIDGGSEAALDRFRAILTATSAPPGPAITWLGETVVHSSDIRRPLGLAHGFPTESLVQVADFYKGSNLLIGSKKRIAGVTLRATDVEWTTGSGPLAAGPILSLILAMTGRSAALDDLTGEGVAALRSR